MGTKGDEPSAKDLLGEMELGRKCDRNARRAAYSPTSMRERGSRKSRSASPMKLKESTASITASAGKSTRCGASNKWARPSLSMAPQLAVGGATPKPRKLMVASARMAPAIPIAAFSISGCMVLGRKGGECGEG